MLFLFLCANIKLHVAFERVSEQAYKKHSELEAKTNFLEYFWLMWLIWYFIFPSSFDI